ncbi:condensation domain-containing protein, partial [Alcaligenes faecalis]|uniref:condensation domain-containing protein n=1 Tax=Alcaligenes faecalis TaxID=511 RepID=UPI0029327ED6
MSRKEQRAARRAALSPAQKEALQARLKGQGQAVEQRRTIAHAYARQEGVMSFAQKRQWFFWQLDPENTAYHMCGGLRLQGVLDVPALCSALQTVLDRHAVLRTTFQADEQEGVRALVHAHIDLELAQIDLSESAGAIPSLEDCIAQACQRPFDLIQGPVWRFELLRTAEQDHHLLVVVHHIACDEWSVQIILNELQALYRANCLGQAANLADLPIEYADYAQWQQDWMQGAEATRQLDWWRSELGNEHDVIALPVDQARRADSSYRAAQYGLTLDADVLERLKAYAGQSGSTLFMVLMAAFHACLYRYTGQGVVRAGFPLAQRHLSETNAVVGMFINTQIVQSRPHGRMSLQELLVQIKQAVIDAQMHQDLPFDHLVEALQPQRHAGVHPLFQVMFNHLRREGQESLSWPQLQVQRLHFAEPHAQFELAVQTLEDETGALNIRFVYAQELFKPERIARMAAHYQAVLLALLEGGETRLDEVSMLDKVDIQPLLAWANGPTQEIDFVPVHRLFEQQAAACPDAPALIVDDVAVSYETLNTQANRLAHALLARGLGADQLVGIALERSLDMVVSLLAVLK